MEKFTDYILEMEEDEELYAEMLSFFLALDDEMLSAEEQYKYFKIMDLISELEDDEVDEPTEIAGMSEAPLKKRINRADRMKRKRDYKKNKAKLKRKAKKYRKTAKFKKYKKVAKRNAKRGKTGSGKRKTKFLK